MKQIISLHVGQGGVQLGSTCWQLFCLEHGFNDQGFQPIQNKVPYSSYFSESLKGKHVPRALFIDLDSEATNKVLTSPQRDLYSRQNIIGGKENAGSNFARGYQLLGKRSICGFMDAIRKQVEKCQSIQGFLIFSSLGGGTGGGLGSLLLETLSNEYQTCKKMSFNIYPSVVSSTSCIEPYNYALSTYFRMKHQSLAVVLDNQAVYNICERNLDIERPTYSNMNRLIAQAVSTITATSRFNRDSNNIQTQLVPYPRLHYLLSSIAPIRKENRFNEKLSLMEVTKQAFEPANQLALCDPKKGKFIFCSFKYRGDINPKDTSSCYHTLIKNRTINFVDWCPGGSTFRIFNQYNRVFPDGNIAQENQTLCLLSNSTSISTVFQRQNYNFNIMLRKKAFLHYLTSDGLEEAVFSEIKEDLASLECDYHQAQKESQFEEGAQQG